MSDEFQSGLISGVLATIAGFALTMVWDVWKLRREATRRARSVLIALEHELSENLDLIAINRKLIENELAILDNGHHSIPTLIPFNHGMWDLMKTNLPDALLEHETLLVKLRDITFSAIHLNEGITSRQTYKDTGSIITTFAQNMKNRNNLLVAELDAFTKTVEEGLSELKLVKSSCRVQ